jgi:signal-transduction protein with cAMP-binding, CBS, and nucleotidyltransferase domain
MRVQDVMTQDVKTVSPATSAADAWNLMVTHRIHHLVVRDGGRIVGVLSDRDAGSRRGAALRKTRIVGELMTSPVVTVPPTTTVRRAANMMRGRSIGCLVVVKAGNAAGIVTVSDLLDLIGRGIERSVTTTPRRLLNFRAPHRKRHRAAGPW